MTICHYVINNDKYMPRLCPGYAPIMPRLCPGYAPVMPRLRPGYTLVMSQLCPRKPGFPVSSFSFTYETDSHGFLFVCKFFQTFFAFGNLFDNIFGQTSNRKHSVSQSILRNLTKKKSLILYPVHCLEKFDVFCEVLLFKKITKR